MTTEGTAGKSDAPTVTEFAAEDARRELGEIINRVGFGGERVVITRHGKPAVAVVSLADLERLNAA